MARLAAGPPAFLCIVAFGVNVRFCRSVRDLRHDVATWQRSARDAHLLSCLAECCDTDLRRVLALTRALRLHLEDRIERIDPVDRFIWLNLVIGSAGSILSVGSVGSLASAFSIGSAASVGSILSALSRWSILAWRSGGHAPLPRR
jgi:hypothetical protein